MDLQLSPSLRESVRPAVEHLIANSVASRLAELDDTIWGEAAQPEASIRLGWIGSAQDSVSLIPEIIKLRDEFRAAGIDRFVLCGMGGSSLAPEVIAKNSGIELVVLDSTAPDQVASALIDLDRTAIVVSSKSGSTVETDSQKRAFEVAFTDAGIDPAERIVIVTDPGSPLEQDSRSRGYRVFNADPKVGGRYSALTAFGLVPTGLAGADITRLLSSASSIGSSLAFDSEDNPAIWLAAAMAGNASAVDKFLIETDRLPGFGDWAEQLVAESTGKDGRGVLPVVVTASAPELANPAADTVRMGFGPLENRYDLAFRGELGELFLVWEFATALSGYLLEINPFDQPNVESAKVAARSLLDSPQAKREIKFVDRGIEVRTSGFDVIGATVEAAIEQLLALANDRSYFSFQVYLNRPEYPQFEQLRDVTASRTGRPTTFGWGPRFLHSTGQYHKGGPKQGIFIQITGEHGHDLAISDRPFTFGELITAQAEGDANVIAENGLPVLSLHLTEPLSQLVLIKKAIAS
ncbi:MAG: glucose-6-phosphate isomerase [Aquiluna sp.]